ncbi:MAG: hypothetical protein Pg6C_11480 [Treponemataceae bacterium]|nr:MAG: hypothetical protein Pg6C_11480 [Treponemataceae bacterium]
MRRAVKDEGANFDLATRDGQEQFADWLLKFVHNWESKVDTENKVLRGIFEQFQGFLQRLKAIIERLKGKDEPEIYKWLGQVLGKPAQPYNTGMVRRLNENLAGEAAFPRQASAFINERLVASPAEANGESLADMDPQESAGAIAGGYARAQEREQEAARESESAETISEKIQGLKAVKYDELQENSKAAGDKAFNELKPITIGKQTIQFVKTAVGKIWGETNFPSLSYVPFFRQLLATSVYIGTSNDVSSKQRKDGSEHKQHPNIKQYRHYVNVIRHNDKDY